MNSTEDIFRRSINYVHRPQITPSFELEEHQHIRHIELGRSSQILDHPN